MQNTIRRASQALTEQEARQILGVPEKAAWEEILRVSVPSSSKQLVCRKADI